jgi:hypothetical protein
LALGPDFFLWSYIKNEVFILPLPETLETLKERTRNGVERVHHDMLQNV